VIPLQQTRTVFGYIGGQSGQPGERVELLSSPQDYPADRPTEETPQVENDELATVAVLGYD